MCGQVIEYQTDIRLEKGRLVTEERYVIQIDSKDSDWLSDVSIHYQQGDKIDILEASIVNLQGKVLRSLEKKEITTRNYISGGAFFQDDWVQQFSLKWNQFPYRIVYHYRTVEDKYLYLCYWSPATRYNVSVKKADLSVSYPRELPVRIHHPKNQKSDSSIIKGQVVHKWHFVDLAPLKREAFAPAPFDLLPQIIVAPKQFFYGVEGSMESWATYGKWRAALNAGTNDLPQSEVLKVNQLIRGTTDKKEIIKRLYHYMQDNTRYINVSIDVGGLKSYPASYVSKNKYGDCKALTTFMKSLLQSAGIESYYAHVNGSDVPPVIYHEVPGPQFNHVILCVPIQKDTIWLENTNNSLPYNYLGTFTQGREALVSSDVGGTIVRTPAMLPSTVKTVKRYDFQIDNEGSGKASAALRLRGDEFENIRNFQVNETEENLKTALSESLPNGFQLVTWKIQQENRDTPEVELLMELEVTGQVRKLGTTLMLKPLSISLPGLEDPQRRKSPVVMAFPTDVEQITSYTLSFMDGYAVSLPQNGSLVTPFGSYEVAYRLDDDVVRVSRHLIVHKASIPVSDYAKFHAFYKGIKELDRLSGIAFNPKP